LWQETSALGAPRSHAGFLMTASWPDLPDSLMNHEVERDIDLVIATISEGRSVRAELNVPNSAKPALLVVEADPAQTKVLKDAAPLIIQLLRVAEVRFVDSVPEGAIPYVLDGATLALPVAEFIDVAAERSRLGKEVGSLASDIDRTSRKLANADFVARAPEEVVEENRERLAEAQAAKAKLEAALARLGAVA
jgi:valyl-tRNA synthetase